MPIPASKAAIILVGCMILPLWNCPVSLSATPDFALASKAKAAPPAYKLVFKHVDQRLAHLKKALAITKDQQPAWLGFAEVMRSNMIGISKLDHERQVKLATMNAIANIESYAAIASQQADNMTALSAAFHILYQRPHTLTHQLSVRPLVFF